MLKNSLISLCAARIESTHMPPSPSDLSVSALRVVVMKLWLLDCKGVSRSFLRGAPQLKMLFLIVLRCYLHFFHRVDIYLDGAEAVADQTAGALA